MQRDTNLVPLSHQHQHALALCVRLDRAPKADVQELKEWNREIDRLFRSEVRFHFDAEERLLFPEANRFPELAPLVNELAGEHGRLRGWSERAGREELGRDALVEFAALLAAHIRKEERQLFEACQRLMSPEQIARVGAALNDYFRALPGASCAIK